MLRLALELGHALRRRRLRALADLGDGVRRDGAQLGPGLERGELDVQPARELALLRPDPGHRRSGVARDHRLESRARAGGPPGTKSHTLGTIPVTHPRAFLRHRRDYPGWVGARDGSRDSAWSGAAAGRVGSAARGCGPRARRRSSRCRRRPPRRARPAASARSRAARRARRARSVASAAARRSPAGRCAPRPRPAAPPPGPAPAISTRIPRSRAVRAYSATASGLRWAERTSNSYAMPRASSSSSAGCIASRSDSEPTRMPTSGPSAADMTLGGRECDVAPVAHAGERDPARRLVRARPRGSRGRRRSP